MPWVRSLTRNVVGVIFFVTGHDVLGIVLLLMSLPFALATWVKWSDRGI